MSDWQPDKRPCRELGAGGAPHPVRRDALDNQGPKPGERQSVLHCLLVFALCVLYVTWFWGEAGRFMPAPFDGWYEVPYRVIAPWWHAHMPGFLRYAEQVALYQVVEAYILALALPLLALRSFGLSRAGTGLEWPARRGASVTLAGLVLTVPIGFGLAIATPHPWGTPLQEGFEFLTLVPEHFLIFGFFGALFLPARRLGWPSPPAMKPVLFAVVATTVIFGLVHVGSPHGIEVIASIALGLVFALMTIFSGSIWPAVIAHCLLNLLPMAFVPPRV